MAEQANYVINENFESDLDSWWFRSDWNGGNWEVKGGVGADGPLFRVHDSPQAHALRRPKGQCKQPETEHGCTEHRKILSFHPLPLPAMSV